MELLTQKKHLKIFLKNNYFKPITNNLLEIIDKAFFTIDQKVHISKNGNINTWAFDFRIPLLKSSLNRNLFVYISNYLSTLNYETIAIKGIGGMPFISLNQYNNIKNVLIVREIPKEHGFRQEIEGMADNNKPVCLIDDIINSGKSILMANEILSKNNYHVNKYFCIANFKWGNKNFDPSIIDSIFEITNE